jgi:uncharacterized alkaline shock family protein YloU
VSEAQEPTGPELSVGRGVIAEVARLAALEVPDVLRVGRGGSPLRVALAGTPVSIHVRGDQVSVRMWIIARPGADLTATTGRVRGAVGTAIERLLGLRLGSVTVLVDGVGG